jgi:hypothetical protein
VTPQVVAQPTRKRKCAWGSVWIEESNLERPTSEWCRRSDVWRLESSVVVVAEITDYGTICALAGCVFVELVHRRWPPAPSERLDVLET